MTNEIWLPIEGFDKHLVSNTGRIKTTAKTWVTGKRLTRFFPEKMKKMKSDKDGYLSVGIKQDKRVTTLRVHRAVAKAFIPNPENKPFVNHKNGIKYDNRVENLEWVTHSENVRHAIRTGLSVIGEADNARYKKLNSEQVKQILNHRGTYRSIAKLFSVSEGTISKIKRRLLWKSVQPH